MSFEKQDNWEDVSPPYARMPIAWARLTPPRDRRVYQARLDGSDAWIRMNDFPDEPLYTLVVSGVEVIHFNEWPAAWSK
jgi:hypothetical protein